MPLVDLTTNLKSLKYGRDTTNGGSSGEPFITKDINGLTIEDLGRTGGSDLLIRGGFLLPGRISDDVKRIGKYLSTPEGLLWSATQNVLSTSGVRIYGGYPKLAQAANIFRLNDGTYLPSSTLLQLAANPIGGHLNKQGTDPTGLSVLGRPEYVKLQRDLKTANLVLAGNLELNRLLKLRKEHITGFSSGPIYSYLGGPGAGRLAGGVGKTDIRFADQRTPTYQQFNDSYFQATKDNIFSKFIKTTFSSNLIEVTTYGVSNTYGLNPEVNNLISRGNGLIGTGNGTFGESVINSNEFQNTPLNEGNLVDRNAVLNLPNDLPINPDGTPNPNFDPTSVKDIPTIASKYEENFNKEYKVKGGPEETRAFDISIPNPDRRFDEQTLPDSYPTKAEVGGVSKEAKIGETENQIQDGNIVIDSSIQANFGNNATLTPDELTEVADETRGSNTIIDFRRRVKKKNNKDTRKNGSLTDSLKWDANPTKQIETRVRLGDPGNPNIDRSNYENGGGSAKTGVDRINSLYLYKSSIPKPTAIINDLVKFRIATIDNDNPSKVTYAHFRAFINGMSDSYSAAWDSFKYMGRGESFYNYQGFNRSMRLNWTVIAQSREELSIMYQKLNYLASTLAPDYSAAGFMRGNIHRLTIGGYVYEYPGIIESLDFTIPDDTTWEIGIPTNPTQTSNTSGTVSSDTSVKELPHRIEVAMSFRPIDKFLPQTIKDINGAGSINERFLSLQDAFNNNVNDLYHDGIPEWAKTGK
jgi:hypothetical protein